jgi:hypothetical protein
MASYISSNNNRFYVALEPSFGAAAAIGAFRRIPAVSLKARRQRERLERRDKTGTRTFIGLPSNLKHRTSFELSTYMTGWTDQSKAPGHGPLIEAVLGGSARGFTGATAASSNGAQVSTVAPNGLMPGQAIAADGEIRFVTAVVNATTVVLNAPFSAGLTGGSALAPTYSYMPGPALQSASILDYWSPDTAVHRMLAGAAMNRMQVDVNGDLHEFRFSGMAADLIDSSTYSTGEAGLSQFPAEPAAGMFDYTLIPGHLGQAWIGSVPNRFFTLASARVTVDNNVDLRAREFGFAGPRAIVAGQRDVRVDFSVYAQDDDETKHLYQAARQRSPMSVMLQLGQQEGQLCGLFLKSVMAETPEFDDSETRLIWSFRNCRAQGSGDDEIVMAFA